MSSYELIHIYLRAYQETWVGWNDIKARHEIPNIRTLNVPKSKIPLSTTKTTTFVSSFSAMSSTTNDYGYQLIGLHFTNAIFAQSPEKIKCKGLK